MNCVKILCSLVIKWFSVSLLIFNMFEVALVPCKSYFYFFNYLPCRKCRSSLFICETVVSCMQLVLIQNSYYCEWLSLEYAQTCVCDVLTCTRVNVNAAWDCVLSADTVGRDKILLKWYGAISIIVILNHCQGNCVSMDMKIYMKNNSTDFWWLRH